MEQRVFGPDLRLLTGKKVKGDDPVHILCPLHGDTDESLAVYPQHGFCYGKCRRWIGYFEMRQLLGADEGWAGPRYEAHQEPDVTVDVDDLEAMAKAYQERLFLMKKEDYLLGPKRGLTLETIRRHGLGYRDDWWGWSIPIYSFGQFQTVRYRRPAGDPKYLGTKHLNNTTLYTPGPLAERIVWCEGEFDCLVATQLGYSAATLSNGIGAEPTPEITAALVGVGVKAVDVVVDLDRASFGRAFKLADQLETMAGFQVTIRRLGRKDLTEVWTRDGEGAVRKALGAVPFRGKDEFHVAYHWHKHLRDHAEVDDVPGGWREMVDAT